MYDWVRQYRVSRSQHCGTNGATAGGQDTGHKGCVPSSDETTAKVFPWIGWFYRRFIPNFSSIASPLTDLTKRDRPNSIKDWQDHHEKAFQTLKSRLTSSPILRLPIFSEGYPFIVSTDASDVGIGAVLLQEFEGEGRLPIAYASKKLLPRERNYSVIEKECLGIILEIEKFRKYLY